jgi:hypothetical protein
VTSERPTIAADLDVNESEDGLIIYVPTTDRVHYLNATASVVLELCDGSRTAEEIAEGVRQLFELELSPVVETKECLARLLREGLVS